MTRPTNTMPFTTRLQYQVEEISIEEFMEVVNSSREKNNDAVYMQILEAKMSSLKG